MRSKATATTFLTLALLCVSMISGTAFAQPGPAVSISLGPPLGPLFGSGGGGLITVGWKFQPKANLTITQLGFCDGAPFSTAGLDEPHDVGIFDAAGSLIVSATVPAGSNALLVDNFWYVAVPPTVLLNGEVYTIGAYLPPPGNDQIIHTFGAFGPGVVPPIILDPRVTWLQTVNDYPGGPALAFPTKDLLRTKVLGVFGPTFYIASSSQISTVAIDIKPGSFPNSINLRSNGVVPVAIFGSTVFDALQVDPASLTLAGAKVKVVGKGKYSCQGEDVNRDGRPDLVCHFLTSQLVVESGDSIVALEGTTFAGARFRGQDTVRIVPN
jgi:hypothetical protein